MRATIARMNGGLHHLLVRRRIYKNLEQFPHQDAGKRFFDRVMYGVSILGPAVLLPQVFQVYISRDVSALSLSTWALLGSVNILWAVYGYIHHERPILITNVFTCTLNFGIVIAILLYR